MRKGCLLILVCIKVGAFAQNGSEIILFDAAVNTNGIVLSHPVNITKHKGYDNQPFFFGTDIYYSSETESAQMDIKKYNWKNKRTTVVTHTADNEFSPTITPDKKYISCILQRRNGKQDLVKYPIAGGAPVILIDNLKVGYHAWIDDHSLLLFALEDSVTNALHYFDLTKKKDSRVTDNIGRSVQSIPGEHAASFIQKSSEQWMIKRYKVSTGVSSITSALPGCEFMAFTHSGYIVMSDGKDLFFKKLSAMGDWQKITVNGDLLLKKVTRIALNDNDTKMAIVIAE